MNRKNMGEAIIDEFEILTPAYEAAAVKTLEERIDSLGSDVKIAVQIFSRAIKDDPDYWRTWQANIAMAFKDEWERNINLKTSIHIIANNAARNFLMQLTAGER